MASICYQMRIEWCPFVSSLQIRQLGYSTFFLLQLNSLLTFQPLLLSFHAIIKRWCSMNRSLVTTSDLACRSSLLVNSIPISGRMFERGEIKDVDISLSGDGAMFFWLRPSLSLITINASGLLELGFLAIYKRGRGTLSFEAACETPLAYPKGELRYSLPKVKWARKELRKDWLISTRTAILRSFILILKLLIYVLISVFEVMVADFLTSNVATSDWNFRAAMLLTEDVLDKLSVPLTGEELDTMQKLYHQALKLEMEFFLSLPVDHYTFFPLSKQHISTEHRLTIFSDFDLHALWWILLPFWLRLRLLLHENQIKVNLKVKINQKVKVKLLGCPRLT
ncbi:putative hem oxygenase-like, multi-helical [Helianthus anomalus]